jgi:hypothetical protein
MLCKDPKGSFAVFRLYNDHQYASFVYQTLKWFKISVISYNTYLPKDLRDVSMLFAREVLRKIYFKVDVNRLSLERQYK